MLKIIMKKIDIYMSILKISLNNTLYMLMISYASIITISFILIVMKLLNLDYSKFAATFIYGTLTSHIIFSIVIVCKEIKIIASDKQFKLDYALFQTIKKIVKNAGGVERGKGYLFKIRYKKTNTLVCVQEQKVGDGLIKAWVEKHNKKIVLKKYFGKEVLDLFCKHYRKKSQEKKK